MIVNHAAIMNVMDYRRVVHVHAGPMVFNDARGLP